MARRAASIWRAVTRSGSSAFRPYSPKASVVPPLAWPLMRPLKALRYLVRFGLCMILPEPASTPGLGFFEALVLDHRVVDHDLALEHPDLHAAGAEGGERRRRAVVDIGAQRVQRHATLAVPLHTRDLGAAQAARAIDPDAERAQ